MKVFGKGSRTNLKGVGWGGGWRLCVLSAVATPMHPIWRNTPLIWMSHSLPYFLVLHFCFTLFVFLFLKVADSIAHALRKWSGSEINIHIAWYELC
jgi:hypothetical protein